MTKYFLAQKLINCEIWSGTKSIDKLMKWSKQELIDAVDQIDDAMDNYYG